ncbi:hypothetical protein D3C75_1317000 [compost metagenome]
MAFAFQHQQHDFLQCRQVSRRFDPPGLGIQKTGCTALADHQRRGQVDTVFERCGYTDFFDAKRVVRNSGETDLDQA